MALIILEGLDRTGKSSIAKVFEKEGYEIIHLSAPGKQYAQQGYTGPSYLDDMIEMIQKAATRDIVLDRSHYGELVWPQIYNRPPLLTEDDIDIIREIEESVGIRRIMMQDPDTEGHWKRCTENNEPLTRPQFLRARTMFDRLANKYNFEKIVFSETPNFVPQAPMGPGNQENGKPDGANPSIAVSQQVKSSGKTKEQIRLEKANAINEILSKRIVKGKGEAFDEIEVEVRDFLNKKMGTILGTEDKDALSQEEVFIIRAFVKRLKEKDAK
jgi:hypothetical protein